MLRPERAFSGGLIGSGAPGFGAGQSKCESTNLLFPSLGWSPGFVQRRIDENLWVKIRGSGLHSYGPFGI